MSNNLYSDYTTPRWLVKWSTYTTILMGMFVWISEIIADDINFWIPLLAGLPTLWLVMAVIEAALSEDKVIITKTTTYLKSNE